jgi:hypothetical protein
VTVLVLYGFFYILALFGSASIAYFNKPGGRLILPLYIPLVALPVIVGDGLVQAAQRVNGRRLAGRAMAVGGLAVVVLGTVELRSTIPLVLESHAKGVTAGDNSFNNGMWRENPAILYWQPSTATGDFRPFSNEPDGIAFYTRGDVRPAPRRITGPYGTEVMPVADFKDELFGSGRDVDLIGVEPGSNEYYYSPNKLEEIALMDSLFGDDLGSVYRRSPRGKV